MITLLMWTIKKSFFFFYHSSEKVLRQIGDRDIVNLEPFFKRKRPYLPVHKNNIFSFKTKQKWAKKTFSDAFIVMTSAFEITKKRPKPNYDTFFRPFVVVDATMFLFFSQRKLSYLI